MLLELFSKMGLQELSENVNRKSFDCKNIYHNFILQLQSILCWMLPAVGYVYMTVNLYIYAPELVEMESGMFENGDMSPREGGTGCMLAAGC